MEIERIFDLLDDLKKSNQRDDMLAVKRNGRWERFSTDDYYEKVNYLAYGLLAEGVSKGDKVISLSNNRPEWNFLDMALARICAVHVPVYPNLSNNEYDTFLTTQMLFLFLSLLMTFILG